MPDTPSRGRAVPDAGPAPDPIEVRAYHEADAPTVVSLWREVFADDPPRNAPEAVIRRKLSVQPDLFLVASRDGRVVGTALAGYDGCRGWVHHVAVDPALRRSGVGGRLMREAQRRLRELGCPKLNLQVRAGNEGAVRFYRSLGFAVEERVSMGLPLEVGAARPGSG